MNHLYDVTITYRFVVSAPNVDEAYDITEQEAYEIVREEDSKIDVMREITHASQLPEDWVIRSHPWGDTYETIEKHLAALTTVVMHDDKTIDMFAEDV